MLEPSLPGPTILDMLHRQRQIRAEVRYSGNGTPGPATCGVPLHEDRSHFGRRKGAPFLALARPCRHATAPVTIGEALDVPEKRSVYHLFSEASPCASP